MRPGRRATRPSLRVPSGGARRGEPPARDTLDTGEPSLVLVDLGIAVDLLAREPPAALRSALIDEWRRGADGVLRVVEAIRHDRLAVKLSPGSDLA